MSDLISALIFFLHIEIYEIVVVIVIYHKLLWCLHYWEGSALMRTIMLREISPIFRLTAITLS